MLRLILLCGFTPLLSFLPMHHCDTGAMDQHGAYYNLRGNKISLPGVAITKKMIVLTSSEKTAIIQKMILQHMVISVPTGAVMDSMEQAFDQSDRTGTEYLFLVGKLDSISIIVEGNDTAVQTINARKDLGDIKKDVPAYTVHVHEKYPASGRNSLPNPSDSDRVSKHFRDRNQASIVLGYADHSERIITFYYLTNTKNLTFSGFKKLVKKIAAE